MAEEQAKKRRLGTIENVKTAMTARIRSKPQVEGQEYLDLWALKRDRARWVRARQQAEERLGSIDEALSTIHLPEENPLVSPDAPDEPRVARTIDFTTPAGRKPRT